MLLLYAVLIVITALGMITLSFFDLGQDLTNTQAIILVLYAILYFLSIFAVYIVTYVYNALHFNKTMFSAQGYLTHTLPVKPLTTLHVKITVSAIWILITTGLMIVSMFGLAASLISPAMWAEAFVDMKWEDIDIIMRSVYGMGIGEFALYMIISCILGSFYSMLMVSASCSIGQLFNQNKTAFSIVAGVIFYFITQIIGSIYSVANLITVEDSLSDYYGNTLCGAMILNLVFLAIFYVISNVIVRKRINLE